MSTIPNRYYNSPWIAQAGENLAAALAPPDPQKTLAAQRSKWEFAREQELAGVQDTEREDKQAREEAFAKMLEPAINPATGQVDETLNDKFIMENWAEAIRHGGDPTVGQKLAGTASPAFAVQEALAGIKAAQVQAQIQQRFGNQADLAAFLQDRLDTRQSRGFEQAFSMDDRRTAREKGLQLMRQNARMAEIAAKTNGAGAGGGGKAPIIQGKLLEDIVNGIDTMVADSGKKLRPEDYDRIVDLSGKYAQELRSAPGGVLKAWAKVFPGATSYADAPSTDVPEPDSRTNRFLRFLGGNPTDTYLAPNFGDTVVPPMAAPGQAPAAPPGAPPAAASNTPPPAALARLKQGVISTFSNGQQWTLKNGQPTRVK